MTSVMAAIDNFPISIMEKSPLGTLGMASVMAVIETFPISIMDFRYGIRNGRNRDFPNFHYGL